MAESPRKLLANIDADPTAVFAARTSWESRPTRPAGILQMFEEGANPGDSAAKYLVLMSGREALIDQPGQGPQLECVTNNLESITQTQVYQGLMAAMPESVKGLRAKLGVELNAIDESPARGLAQAVLQAAIYRDMISRVGTKGVLLEPNLEAAEFLYQTIVESLLTLPQVNAVQWIIAREEIMPAKVRAVREAIDRSDILGGPLYQEEIVPAATAESEELALAELEVLREELELPPGTTSDEVLVKAIALTRAAKSNLGTIKTAHQNQLARLQGELGLVSAAQGKIKEQLEGLDEVYVATGTKDIAGLITWVHEHGGTLV